MSVDPDRQAQEDLEALFPEREVEVGGRTITVREFGFIEGLKITPRVAPLLEALRAMAASEATFDRILAVLAEHEDELVYLMARASGCTLKEIRALSDEDGQTLLWTFWGINSGFFTRRIVLGAATGAMQASSDGPTPSPS